MSDDNSLNINQENMGPRNECRQDDPGLASFDTRQHDYDRCGSPSVLRETAMCETTMNNSEGGGVIEEPVLSPSSPSHKSMAVCMPSCQILKNVTSEMDASNGHSYKDDVSSSTLVDNISSQHVVEVKGDVRDGNRQSMICVTELSVLMENISSSLQNSPKICDNECSSDHNLDISQSQEPLQLTDQSDSPRDDSAEFKIQITSDNNQSPVRLKTSDSNSDFNQLIAPESKQSPRNILRPNSPESKPKPVAVVRPVQQQSTQLAAAASAAASVANTSTSVITAAASRGSAASSQAAAAAVGKMPTIEISTNSSASRSDFILSEFSKELLQLTRGLCRDEAIKVEKKLMTEKCSFYFGKMSNEEAKQKLHSQPDGSFLLRDSSDPRYLYSLSLRTPRGVTSVRIEQCDCCVADECKHCRSISLLDSIASIKCHLDKENREPSNLSLVLPDSATSASQTSRAMVKLDCERNQRSKMPHFPDALALIEYCRSLGSAEGARSSRRSRCMFIEKDGRMDTPVLLKQPLCRTADT